MAGGRHKAIIDIVANVDSANKDIRSLKKELARTQKELDKLSKAPPPAPVKKSTLASFAEFGAHLSMAYGGAMQLKDGLKEYGKEARRIEGLYRNQAFALEGARKATQGMVTDLDLLRMGNTATALGVVKTQEDFEKFASAADVVGRKVCLLYTSDAADDRQWVELGGGGADTQKK